MARSRRCRERRRTQTLRTVSILSAALCAAQARADEAALTARIAQLESQVRGLLQKREEPAQSRGISLRISGFVQVDAVLFQQDSEDQLDESTGQPLNEARFLIRRARLRATAEARYGGAALEFDGSTVQGAQARLIGAEVWAQWPAASDRPPIV